MSDTPASQAELDAETYKAYQENGESKAETARKLGISATTVGDRVKRHLARAAQDQADEPGEPEPETTEPVTVENQPAGDTEPAAPETATAAPEPEPADGMPPGGHLAYQIPCDTEFGGCGAGAYKPCINTNREGQQILSPYPHPVRVDKAGDRPRAALTAAPGASPETEEQDGTEEQGGDVPDATAAAAALVTAAMSGGKTFEEAVTEVMFGGDESAELTGEIVAELRAHMAPQAAAAPAPVPEPPAGKTKPARTAQPAATGGDGPRPEGDDKSKNGTNGFWRWCTICGYDYRRWIPGKKQCKSPQWCTERKDRNDPAYTPQTAAQAKRAARVSA